MSCMFVPKNEGAKKNTSPMYNSNKTGFSQFWMNSSNNIGKLAVIFVIAAVTRDNGRALLAVCGELPPSPTPPLLVECAAYSHTHSPGAQVDV